MKPILELLAERCVPVSVGYGQTSHLFSRPVSHVVTAGLDGGVLTITGTSGRDVISVREAADGTVFVSAFTRSRTSAVATTLFGSGLTTAAPVVQTWEFHGVTAVNVLAGAGNDKIGVTDLALPWFVDGGTGRDQVFAEFTPREV